MKFLILMGKIGEAPTRIFLQDGTELTGLVSVQGTIAREAKVMRKTVLAERSLPDPKDYRTVCDELVLTFHSPEVEVIHKPPKRKGGAKP